MRSPLWLVGSVDADSPVIGLDGSAGLFTKLACQASPARCCLNLFAVAITEFLRVWFLIMRRSFTCLMVPVTGNSKQHGALGGAVAGSFARCCKHSHHASHSLKSLSEQAWWNSTELPVDMSCVEEPVSTGWERT